MVDSAIFIGSAIIAVLQAIKYFVPAVSGGVTILVAILIGALVGVFDVHMGINDVSVAQGIILALAAVGVHTTVTNHTPANS